MKWREGIIGFAFGVLAGLLFLTSLIKCAHAQASAEQVPPGCFTVDGLSCYEPVGEVVWGYVPDDPEFLLEYYGGPVGTLVNLYVTQYQKLLEWKKLARERGRRLRQSRTAARRSARN